MASPPPYTTGTVTLENGSPRIIGNGTAWLLAGVRGGIMTVEAVGNALTLEAVTADDEATASTRWTGPDGTYAYAISMASADAADTIWASRHWSRVVGGALLAGIVPVASGTLAERDALDPQPANGEWFAHAEPPHDLTFYRKVPSGWEGPYQVRGAASTIPGPAGDGFNPAGAWDAGSTYAKNDMVSHGPRSFVSFANGNTGNEPPDADEDDAYWQFVPAAVGPANTLTIGTVDVGPADASITGDAPNQTLNLTIPQGPAGNDGNDGAAATIAVGTVTTVNPGDPATVTNVGTSAAAVFNFEIPKGQDGTGDGDVAGPDGGVTDGHVAVFDGTTGKIIKSAGKAPFSGSYVDLDDKPTLGDLSEIDLPAEPDGKLLDDSGNWVDPPESGGYDPNMALLALEMADLKGGRMGMVGGVADPFDDESGVDDGVSSNYEHDVENHWFVPRRRFLTAVPSNPIGNAPDYANVNDDNPVTTSTWVGRSLVGAPLADRIIWQLDLGAVTAIENVELKAFRLSKSASTTGSIFTSPDGATWTQLGAAIPNSTTAADHIREGPVSARYVAYAIGGGGWSTWDFILGDLNVYASPPNNMTLTSVAYPAATEPELGRLAVQLVEDDPITINDDVTAEISRDGGTSWSQATLALVSSLDSVKLYEDANIDLSGQPSGDEVVWRVKTDNNVDVAVSGVVAQWR